VTSGPSEPVLAAVLSALAGVRRGDAVAGVGTGPRTTAALLAAAGAERLATGDARVVVAGAAHDVPTALGLLAPGGRLVAVAADAGAARRVAAGAGLDLRHVEPVGRMVAWSAVRPLAP
jgi:protein-L-isoaspartate O-methyltransferase